MLILIFSLGPVLAQAAAKPGGSGNSDGDSSKTPQSIPSSSNSPAPSIQSLPPATSTLQITFPTIFFDKETNIFSKILYEIPGNFPNLKLNTVGRGLHSTLLYLDGIDFTQAEEFIRKLNAIPISVWDDYGLNRQVKVFDPRNLEFEVVGVHNKFLAIKPHREFIDWQFNFWQMIEREMPEFMDMHKSHRNLGDKATSRNSVHISLVQWGESWNLDLNDYEVERLKEDFSQIVGKALDDAEKGGRSYDTITFNPATQPLQLVAAPRALAEPPMVMSAFNVKSDKSESSKMIRWQLNEPMSDEGGRTNGPSRSLDFTEGEKLRVVEFNQGDQNFKENVNGQFLGNWIDQSSRYYPMNLGEFKSGLSYDVNEIFSSSLKTLSPTLYPAEYKSQFNDSSVYITNETHPMVAPEKAVQVFDQVSDLSIQSTKHVSVGLSLYASSVRSEVKYPGDFDFLMNTVTKVPSEIKTEEEARKFAYDTFNREIFGQLRQLIGQGKVALSELRIGSDYTMGYRSNDVIADMEENPYLTEKDVLENSFTDKKGKVWTLNELLALEDFVKAKLDLLVDGRRFEISLQFNLGFFWKGNVFSLQRSSLKGLSPLLRTAAYDSKESYALAAALARPFQLYQIQKGSIVASAIRELQKHAYKHLDEGQRDSVDKTPLYHSKFLKKVYNYFILLNRSGLHLDSLFFNEYLNLSGKQMTIEQLTSQLTRAVNSNELSAITALKRVFNDIREYHERNQKFNHWQLDTRIAEIESLLPNLRATVESLQAQGIDTLSFEKSINDISKSILRMKNLSKTTAINYLSSKAAYEVFRNGEDTLTLIDGAVCQLRLPENAKVLIQTLVDYSPFLLLKYLKDRDRMSPQSLRWVIRKMGLKPPADYKGLFDLADNLDFVPKEDFLNESNKYKFSTEQELKEVRTSSQSTQPDHSRSYFDYRSVPVKSCKGLFSAQ
ncbi:MAG: hypothetical protein CL677_05475 [Bdellovibrionaceae bacterium]|nr:hypothetical protein [Pseudobdellovibrionaceae bacterium]|tara:strand:+ start:15025 stop:17868 length:2844 start_codon:yes stop_codon:yes gene_type:complete